MTDRPTGSTPRENRSRSQQDIPIDVEAAILELKRERRAIILAHYYQDSEVQDIADVVGDSLALAQAAQKADCDVIAFCGVHFMAETAKILNPSKKVVVPDLEAGCSLAESCTPEALAELKAKHPDHLVVSYVNTTAAVKALSDYCCTSSNATQIINSIPADQKIIFAPDVNLGRWVQEQTGRDMVLWPGTCTRPSTRSTCSSYWLRTRAPSSSRTPSVSRRSCVTPTSSAPPRNYSTTPSRVR
jgi:quinolinate synthase